LANIAWACAKLGYVYKPLFEAIASASLNRLSNFVPQDFANISWSFAKLGYLNTPLMKALAAAALLKIREFNP
jgi:hypothetical protein